MNWRKKEIDPREVVETNRLYDLDGLFPQFKDREAARWGDLAASIFLRRGVNTGTALQFYLENDLRYTHSPFLFQQMEDAVERILAARDENEKVLVYGDRDADGITSTVLMVEGLRELGLDPQWRLPSGDDPYGLTEQAVRDFAEKGGTLIITVDCGISNLKEIEMAVDLGIDVIVVDHHGAPEVLPPACVIINPRLPGETYPFPFLAACGVVSKVVWALRFSQIPQLYGHSFCLLHARLLEPEGEGSLAQLEVTAVRLHNLLEVKRLRQVYSEKNVGDQRAVLGEFLQGQEILVYQAPGQKELLGTIFGPRADVYLTDMAPALGQAFPTLAGLSLESLAARSRMNRYREGLGLLDVLVNLFLSYQMKIHPSLSQDFASRLDLVAIGTLADMMPLEDENRILIKKGMEVLISKPRPGVASLLMKQNMFGKRLSTSDVSWYLTPLINASGRLGSPEKAAELFLTPDPVRREVLAGELGDLNSQRRQMSQEAWEQVITQGRASLENLGTFAAVYLTDVSRGITGILASRLMAALDVPSLVMTLQGDRIIGSLRTNRGFDTRRFLDSFSDLFSDYGGHDAAAGFHFPLEKKEEFLTRLARTAKEFPLTSGQEDFLDLDAEIPLEYLSRRDESPLCLDKLMDLFEPYGEGNRPLILGVKGALLESVEPVGKNGGGHLKLLLGCEGSKGSGGTPSGAVQTGSGDFQGIKWSALFWNGLESYDQGGWKPGDRVQVAFSLGRNFYGNRETLQLTVSDIRRIPTSR